MPFSGRPLRTTAPILFPSTSVATSLERVRSGPVSPPPASRPWQKEQSFRKSALPLSIKAGGHDFLTRAAFFLSALHILPYARRPRTRKRTLVSVPGRLWPRIFTVGDEKPCCLPSFPAPT